MARRQRSRTRQKKDHLPGKQVARGETRGQESRHDIDEEAFPLLNEMLGKEGWDDPAMDIYNDITPREIR